MKADKSLKEGIAFEADKYEGAITSFLTVDSAFGGKLDPSNMNTPGNVAALNWLHDAIYTSKIAPQAVTSWQEGQVQAEFTSGYAPFAINYPFVEAQTPAPAVRATSATSRSRPARAGRPARRSAARCSGSTPRPRTPRRPRS